MNDSQSLERFRRRGKALSSALAKEMNRVGAFHAAETFVIDVEASNRCHATCDFCPRDRTPHQGFMSQDTFGQVLNRAMEFRDIVQEMQAGRLDFSFCGLGEGALNPLLPGFMRMATDAGFRPCLCTNGDLLTERRSQELLDAGLCDIFINVGALNEEYDRVYGLSFERTVRNIERFMELAQDRCHTWIVLVDYRMDAEHTARVRAFWEARGVRRFYPSPMLNRTGAIEHEVLNFHDHAMEASARALFDGNVPGCYAPIQCIVIGYDGNFYLCNSDWQKEEAAGSVFEVSVTEAMRRRLSRARDRNCSICQRCNHDPLNQVSRMLAEGAEPDLVRASVDVLQQRERSADAFLAALARRGYLADPAGLASP